MANCTICGEFSGLVRTHPHCEAQLKLGQTPEQIRGIERRMVDTKIKVSLNDCAKRLPTLCGLMFPFFIIGFAVMGVEARTENDPITLIYGSVGALFGILVASLLYTLCALLSAAALRIAHYLDEKERSV